MVTTSPAAFSKRSGDLPRFLLFSTALHSEGTATATLPPPERLYTRRLSQRGSSARESVGAATSAVASKASATCSFSGPSPCTCASESIREHVCHTRKNV